MIQITDNQSARMDKYLEPKGYKLTIITRDTIAHDELLHVEYPNKGIEPANSNTVKQWVRRYLTREGYTIVISSTPYGFYVLFR